MAAIKILQESENWANVVIEAQAVSYNINLPEKIIVNIFIWHQQTDTNIQGHNRTLTKNIYKIFPKIKKELKSTTNKIKFRSDNLYPTTDNCSLCFLFVACCWIYTNLPHILFRPRSSFFLHQVLPQFLLPPWKKI